MFSVTDITLVKTDLGRLVVEHGRVIIKYFVFALRIERAVYALFAHLKKSVVSSKVFCNACQMKNQNEWFEASCMFLESIPLSQRRDGNFLIIIVKLPSFVFLSTF